MENEMKKIHRLLLQNIQEENEKKNKELLNPKFNMNSQNNLISIARQSLKNKLNNKYRKIVKLMPIKRQRPIKPMTKRNYYLSEKKNKELTNSITFSDKEYLNYIMKDLKIISSSIKRKQILFHSKNYSNKNFSVLQNRKKQNINNDNICINNKLNSYRTVNKKNCNNRRSLNINMNKINNNYNCLNVLNITIQKKIKIIKLKL